MVDSVNTSVINLVNAPVVTPTGNNGNTAAISRKPAENSGDQEQSQSVLPIPKEEIPKENLNKAVEVANKAFKEVNIGFEYTFDKKANREVIKIVNSQTGEVIRQLPPEEILNFLSRMYDMLGILIDKKV